MEWQNGTDSNGDHVHRYEIETKYLSPVVTMGEEYKTFSLFGKIGRIFCPDCTRNKLRKCQIVYDVGKCEYYDGTQCNYRDTEECCKLHIQCGAGGSEGFKGIDGKIYTVPKCMYERKVFDGPTDFENRKWFSKWYDDDIDEYCSEAREKIICSKCGKYDKTESLSDDNLPYWKTSGGYCYFESDDEDGLSIEDLSIKKYHLNKSQYRSADVYGHWRFSRKICNLKKIKQRKSFMKSKNDKRSNRKMNKSFKRRYLLSLQF